MTMNNEYGHFSMISENLDFGIYPRMIVENCRFPVKAIPVIMSFYDVGLNGGVSLNTIIIANIFAFVGACLMAGIGLLKKKKQILIVQCVQFTIMGFANLLLGGMTGFISNIASIARNLFCLKWEYTMPWKFVFIAMQIVLSAGMNNLGILGWLPVISAVIFTWFLDLKNEVHLKIVIIIAQVMWIIYDFSLMNYVTFVFGILTVISNLVGIRMILQDRKKIQQNVSEK